ncbi:isochorismatase family protein [Celerinatantimonas yamalensis]|uniref:nicotinamidase n=1 Tax=Celerinatantimonas yamalensis TaxID=559956 RepID=A0ABW9G2I4_9GAMM
MTHTQQDITPRSSDALMIIDLQNDFLPNGSLGIKSAAQIIEPINRYTELFERAQSTIILSRDWHPQDHCSFSQQGGPWPVHCVRNSEGAQISADYRWPTQAWLVSKATTSAKDAYSAFDGTELATQLQHSAVKRLFICGLATDYCVLNTVLDALKEGFECYLLCDGMDAVNIQSHDGQQAIDTMCQQGAIALTLTDFNHH